MMRRVPRTSPGLRPSQQFVAAHRHDRRTGLHGVSSRRFAGQPIRLERRQEAASEIVQHRHAMLGAERRELVGRDVGDEAGLLEVAAVHFQDDRAVRFQRASIVGEVRAIRRANLDQARAAPLHDLGNTEASADLDQFAARHDRRAAVGQCVERQHQSRRAVVHDQRVLGAGELAQQRRAVRVARPALAARYVVFEIRESARHTVDRVQRHGGERRSAEVRVQHDARRVDHAPQRTTRGIVHGVRHGRGPALGVGGSLGVRRPDRRDGAPNRVDHHAARNVLEQRLNALALEERGDARETSSCVRHCGERRAQCGGLDGGGRPTGGRVESGRARVVSFGGGLGRGG